MGRDKAIIYGTNDRALEANLRVPRAIRVNPKYFDGILDYRACEVYILDGSPNAEVIASAYRAAGIPVRLMEPEAGGGRKELSAPPAVPSGPSRDEKPVADPAPPSDPELESWTSRFTPEEYLRRWPKGPRSELARRHVEASRRSA